MSDKNNVATRWMIAGTYALLIALLLLSNCRGNHSPAQPLDNNATAEERAEQVGNDGEIKVTALWDFPGDVDLHVTEPDGTEIWFRNMKHRRTGGELDVDDIPGGPGSAENIYWSSPMRGEYAVEVVMYATNDNEAPNGGPVNVVIKVHGQSETIPVRLTRQGQRLLVKKFVY